MFIHLLLYYPFVILLKDRNPPFTINVAITFIDLVDNTSSVSLEMLDTSGYLLKINFSLFLSNSTQFR